MKKLAILTSIVALAACSTGGGGSSVGGGSGVPHSPSYLVPSENESLQANANNTGITNMASKTITNEAEARSARVDYVGDQLDGIYSSETLNSLPTRGATNGGSRSGLTDEQKFFIAHAKLSAMENTLAEMASATDLEQYITNHTYAVGEALKLYGADVDLENLNVADLVTIFGDTGINADNVQTKIKNMYENTPGYDMAYEYTTLDNDVKLRGSGEDSYFKFTLDSYGKITGITLMERNGDDYVENEYGEFARNSNGTEFTKQLYQYTFNLGQSGNTWFDGITGINDIIHLSFINQVDLNNQGKKAEMLAKLRAEFADFKASQPDHTHDGDIDEALTNYEEAINAAFDALGENWATGHDLLVGFGEEDEDINATVTMTGVGKDLHLKYSDFGYAELAIPRSNGNIEHNYVTYAGGYEERKVDPETNMTFKGTAVAGIQYENSNGSDGMLVKDTTAKLNFNTSGVSTLVMNNLTGIGDNAGEKWYNVTISSKEGADGYLDFTFNKAGKNIDSNYQFDGNPGTLHKRFTSDDFDAHDGEYVQNPDEYRHAGNMNVDFYGPTSDNATEATATFNFSEDHHWVEGRSEEEHRVVEMYGAFGGEKQ